MREYIPRSPTRRASHAGKAGASDPSGGAKRSGRRTRDNHGLGAYNEAATTPIRLLPADCMLRVVRNASTPLITKVSFNWVVAIRCDMPGKRSCGVLVCCR